LSDDERRWRSFSKRESPIYCYTDRDWCQGSAVMSAHLSMQAEMRGWLKSQAVFMLSSIDTKLNSRFDRILCQFYAEIYQQAKQESKLEIAPKLLKKGLSIQEVAEILELDVHLLAK
jgi:hypothetical protein